jgi:hypothetical protein|nr:MAG TPA: hypothetical protein [Caudoviricetes sp.]
MNERFIELKDDLKNILTKVNKSPSYYYNNWITKMINNGKTANKDIVNIFKRWTDPSLTNTLSAKRYKEITDISILKLSTLLTDMGNNADLALFLCTIYDCVDHMEYLIELYSNEFQHQKFKEQYKNQISKETDYECGILVDDNLGLIKAVLDNPDMVKSVHLKDQVNTLVKKEWYPIYIADNIAGYKNTGWIRNYFELDKIGYVDRLKVLDGKVMADIFSYPGECDILLENEDYPNYHKDIILRPVYIVQDVGMISKVDPSQKDNIVRIAGFDICINKVKRNAK